MRVKLQERPGQFLDVRNWCQSCSSCTTRKTPVPKRRAPLGTVSTSYPMQIIAVDILGPLPKTGNGNCYVLVATDYYTRWVEAYAIPDQGASTVAQKLVNELFCRFSSPEQLHSDQGRRFESELVAEVCKLLKICKTRTTPITLRVTDWWKGSTAHCWTCWAPPIRSNLQTGRIICGRSALLIIPAFSPPLDIHHFS